jgi:hypothetical protein
MTVRQLINLLEENNIDQDKEICLDDYDPNTDGIFFDYIKTRVLTDIVEVDNVVVFQAL